MWLTHICWVGLSSAVSHQALDSHVYHNAVKMIGRLYFTESSLYLVYSPDVLRDLLSCLSAGLRLEIRLPFPGTV